MYLKTLTIRGFKSFASKTTFEFEPGVTSVIGPNGSGKSNVVDALAWVMGEQGAKNLRGGKMEDVIFAGTTGRAPLGRAQVELTIDNSDATLPIDFTEVTISRTLFRSGGSEYHINGEPARLLDIQELLSDSGLGREMHVIVGQGQLDRILQATPEERRGFIEEAAGILKHRRRKERSERKLESMRTNLDRIRDLTDEVHRQLGPLSRQANTARKAQRVQHDVHDATARLLADDIVAESLRLHELEQSDGALEQQQRDAQEQLQHHETRAEELGTRHAQTTQAAARARDHRYQLTAMAERFRSVRALATERLKTASRPPVASSGLSPEEAEQQLANNEAALNQHRDALTRTQTELQKAAQIREIAEKQVRIARETYTQLVRQEADQHKTMAQAESRLNTARSTLESLKSQLDRVTQEHQVDSSSVTESTDEIRGYEQELQEAQARLDSVQQEHEQARQEVLETQGLFTAAEKTVNESNTKLSSAKARVEVLEQSLRPAAGSGLAELMKFDGKDLSEVLDVEPGWEKAVASLLAGSTDRLWLDSLDSLLRGIHQLDGQEHADIRVFYGLATEEKHIHPNISDAVPVTSVISPRQNAALIFGALEAYLSDAYLVEDLTTAIRMVKEQQIFAQRPDLRLVTRLGEVITKAWVELRGSGGVTSLEQRASYDASVEAAEKLHHELEAMVAARDKLRKLLDQKRQTSRSYEPQVAQLRQEVTTLQERITIHHRDLKRQHDARERNAKQQAQLKTEVVKAQQVFDQAHERHEAVVAASKLSTQAAGGVDEASESQQIAERDATVARATETEARLALRTVENAIEQAEQRVAQAKRRVSAARIAQQEYQRAIIRQRRMQDRLTALTEAIEIAIQHVARSITRAESDHDALEQQRLTLDGELKDTEHQLGSIRKTLAELQEKLHKRSLLRQEHEIKLEQLRERSLNELGYSHEYLVKNFGPDQPVDTGDENAEVIFYDRAEQQKRLRAAKRNLSALGKINPLALEEYSAVKERHEYLTQQLQDLETSRKDLLKIIEDVNQTVLQVFTSAYEDTAAQFEHVFATLFPGGEGRLSLTEPENMLETGIEVEARPAGKKVKRLSLLSGGERSLAAIAMLVSIFKARPSPFYVMDEVEAALDDTNLTRLLTIFKELQADSQLIIITHQKRTMEISDALYGVSMRGDGVSQVISQRLEHN